MVTTFDNQGPVMVLSIIELNMDIFERIGLTYWEVVYKMVRCTDHILKLTTNNKYQSVIHSWNVNVAAYIRNNWNFRKDSLYVTMKYFWSFSKAGFLDLNVHSIICRVLIIDFYREICFELAKTMWKNHHNVFDDHIIHVNNYII